MKVPGVVEPMVEEVVETDEANMGSEVSLGVVLDMAGKTVRLILLLKYLNLCVL